MENEKCICDLKEGEEKLINNGDWLNLYINLEKGEYWIAGISDGMAVMKINYCPKCGKKLEEEVEEEDLSEYL